MADQGFPLIQYEKGKSSRDWGQFHGESFRDGIKELTEIRTGLLQGKNPKLVGDVLDSLAEEQWDFTERFDRPLWEELEGIREGAGLSITDIVVLNNYTDFRDIDPEEGCSTVYVSRDSELVCGQTWDMHSTAKDYVCAIHVPQSTIGPECVLFSLVGCVGMMGYNNRALMIGVNNLNTKDARSGILWPALVRRTLTLTNMGQMSQMLQEADVTSAHSYILGSQEGGEIWEITPTKRVRVSQVSASENGVAVHTNHCLAPEVQAIEHAAAQSKTTQVRLDLVKKKVFGVKNVKDLEALLTDHDNYPMSICSHFESGAQDPSFTCGGGVGDMRTGEVALWRGCPTKDANFKRYEFSLFKK